MAQEAHRVVLQMLAPPSMNPGPAHTGQAVWAAFERTCIALELKGIAHPSELTAYQFYSRVDYLESQRPQAERE
ncbi:hypothetical protein GCM10023186_45320 [Hymenobacter koreensis]|uniref:Uncharacterized protein n=2 Tax=Hymenobacter koreensis TaxID=1084523 RepID=A0ABP8JNC1_9BACT